jgi:hypothetical protein
MKTKLDYFNEWKHVLPNFTEEQLRKLFFMMGDYASDYHKREVKKLRLGAVSGMLPLCEHDYMMQDPSWQKCIKCGDIKPSGNYH